MTDLATPQHTVIVTGGNTGLGYEAARHLAADHRWHVVLACRNPDKAQDAAAALRAATGRNFEGRREIRSSEDSYDPAMAAALWEASVTLTGLTADESPLVAREPFAP